MKKSVLLDQAQTPDGKTMTFHERDGVYTIRIDTIELMSTRHHNSEEVIAELGCAHIRAKSEAQVLIGGLGFGFTLRKSLACLSSNAVVTVAEIMPSVVTWNLAPEYNLAADALGDPRVKLVLEDVAKIIAARPAGFDSIILDIDNGTSAFSTEANKNLYREAGLLKAKAALKPGGCLAVWSSHDDPPFAKLMGRLGFDVKVERVQAHKNGGNWHSLFIGRIK